MGVNNTTTRQGVDPGRSFLLFPDLIHRLSFPQTFVSLTPYRNQPVTSPYTLFNQAGSFLFLAPFLKIDSVACPKVSATDTPKLELGECSLASRSMIRMPSVLGH
jgi:hypothetical protein